MITATGNNFGVGEIVLKDYQRDHIIIFNGELSFDPSNEAYRSVDVLEIYFPDLSLNKSSISGILMHGSASPRPRGTCIKTWIKDCNTVCVEKVTAWDNEEQITLSFACAYVPKGQHQTFEPMEWMKVYEMNKVGTVNTGQTYWTMCDDWAWITLTFNSLKQPDEDTYVSFDVRDFPEDLDFSGTMLFNEAISPSVGTEMAKFTIKGKTVTVLDKNMHRYSEQSCGFVVFIIRDHNETNNTTENI